MMTKANSNRARRIRHARVKRKLKGTASRPRLCIFRSLNHIDAQIIDDSRHHTLVSMSTLDHQAKSKTNGMAKVNKAEVVGLLLGEKALGSGIRQVVFDRGGYKYHGRVKALADAARKAGLEF